MVSHDDGASRRTYIIMDTCRKIEREGGREGRPKFRIGKLYACTWAYVKVLEAKSKSPFFLATYTISLQVSQ